MLLRIFLSSGALLAVKVKVSLNICQTCVRLDLAHLFQIMCEPDETLTYFSGTPKPMLFTDKIQKEIEDDDNRIKAQKFKFIEYDVQLENLWRAHRDLKMPFELLKFFQHKIDHSSSDNNSKTTVCKSDWYKLKARLIEIELLILRKKEKGLSLSAIPNLMGEFLDQVDFFMFLEISEEFFSVFQKWIDAVKYNQTEPRRKFRFYSKPRPKSFDFYKLSKSLERIFSVGYDFLGNPVYSQLTGCEFLEFLRKFDVDFAGPFKTVFNGEKLATIFVLSKFKCISFFNRHEPLFGLYNFSANSLPFFKNFDEVPNWFLKPPAIANFEIDKLISNFQKTSVV